MLHLTDIIQTATLTLLKGRMFNFFNFKKICENDEKYYNIEEDLDNIFCIFEQDKVAGSHFQIVFH